jgi:hypothetical protein
VSKYSFLYGLLQQSEPPKPLQPRLLSFRVFFVSFRCLHVYWLLTMMMNCADQISHSHV